MSDSLQAHGLSMGFSRQEYCLVCHSLFQGVFLTQGLNPGFLHCRQILYHLSVHYISFPVPHPELPNLAHSENWQKWIIFFPFSVSGMFFLSSSFEECKLQKHGSVHLRAFEVMRTLVVGWMKKQEHPSMCCWVLGVYPSPVSVSRLICCHIIVNPLQSHRSASPQWVLPPSGIFCGLKPYVILPNRQYEPQSKSHV